MDERVIILSRHQACDDTTLGTFDTYNTVRTVSPDNKGPAANETGDAVSFRVQIMDDSPSTRRPTTIKHSLSTEQEDQGFSEARSIRPDDVPGPPSSSGDWPRDEISADEELILAMARSKQNASVLTAEEEFDQTVRHLWDQLDQQLQAKGLEKGLKDPEVALTYSKIAEHLLEEGRLDEAMELFEKRLEIEKKVFQYDDHPEMASTYQNIACVLKAQGKYDDAMHLFQKVLAINLATFGPDDTSTAIAYRHIGDVLCSQGKHEDACYFADNWYIGDSPRDRGKEEDAMQQYQKALAIFLEAHGPEHPSTASIYQKIGNLLQRQGKVEEAMQQYQKVLVICLEVHGPEHASTAQVYHCIGDVLRRQGKYEEAMQQYQKVLEIRLKTLGPEHSSTADAYHSIGVVLFRQHKYEEAMQQYQAVLGTRLKMYGPEHPLTASTYDSIGGVLHKQGKHKEAIQTFKEAYNIKLKVYGKEHISTQSSWSWIVQIRRIHLPDDRLDWIFTEKISAPWRSDPSIL